jgi:hypothetical protein
MLVTLGGRDIGPNTVGDSEGVFEDDKMLLNCLEHVSYVKVFCLTYYIGLTLYSHFPRH